MGVEKKDSLPTKSRCASGLSVEFNCQPHLGGGMMLLIHDVIIDTDAVTCKQPRSARGTNFNKAVELMCSPIYISA